MPLQNRLELYQRIEELRNRPLIAYVTSTRRGSPALIAADVIGEFMRQLHSLSPKANQLDLLVLSNGGDAPTAGRIVALIRERVDSFAVLVPQAAFSAATLIAMGADEIVMHPQGNLGPIDPQINTGPQGKSVPFAAEDLAAFIEFARSSVGVTDQAQLTEVFTKFCDAVGPVPIGQAARASQLSLLLGQRLLKMHMKEGSQSQKAKSISAKLTKDYMHHGYAVGRSEAKEIGLKIAEDNPELEELLWRLWLDLEDHFELRSEFKPVSIVRKNPNASAIFGGTVVSLPPNITAPQQPIMVPPTPFEQTAAIVESLRVASEFKTSGEILATRQPDLSIKLALTPFFSGWTDVHVKPKMDAQVESKPPSETGKSVEKPAAAPRKRKATRTPS